MIDESAHEEPTDINSAFKSISASLPELEEVGEIVEVPTPPWKEAASEIALPETLRKINEETLLCIKKIENARLADPLFEDMLKELRHDVLNEINGKNSYRISLDLMGKNPNEVGVSLAAEIVRYMPNPKDAETLQMKHDPSDKREEMIRTRDTYLSAVQQIESSYLSPDKLDQKIADIRTSYDPDLRAAARRRVLGVVYGERYVAHLQAQKK